MSLPEKICMLPWISIETSPIGTSRPCCLAIDEITRADGSKYSLRENTLEEIYHSPYMQNLRSDFLAGNKPATCQRCWDEEAAGRTSKRINSRIRLKEYYNSIDFQNTNPNQLWFIDLKLGNICNLKCRICVPVSLDCLWSWVVGLFGWGVSVYIVRDTIIWDTLTLLESGLLFVDF